MIDTILDGLFAFGRIVRSMQASRSKNVLVDVRGDKDQGGNEEKHDKQSMWLMSPILYRPAPPQGDEGEESFFIRRGNEAIVIGTRDLRWQVDLVDGETVIRGLGQNAARVHLKPDGTAVVVATRTEFRDANGAVVTALVQEQGLRTLLNQLVASLATGANGSGPVVFSVPFNAATLNAATLKTERVSVDR
jgi:hypothetical protein